MKRQIISGVTTFGVAFVISLGAQLSSYGSVALTSTVLSSLFLTAVRAAVKAGIEVYLGASGDKSATVGG